MVEASNKADLLEAVEKDQYEVRSADETGGVTLASMATCEHSQVILAYCTQLDTGNDAYQWLSPSKRMGLSWGCL